MTLLADLVAVSQRVAATSGRRAKIDAIAALLRALAPPEVPIASAYLAGETRQGRQGIGYASLAAARMESAALERALSLQAVDEALDGIAGAKGRGSTEARAQRLRELF